MINPDRLQIEKIDCTVYRVPITKVVATSFGIMRDRPAVFVKLTDKDGTFGFGEIFANWPAAGAEHRARLLMEDIADLVLGQTFENPSELFFSLEKKTHIRALQCGEWGPFRHVIAGLDIAAHDLCSRRQNVPLRHYLNPSARDTVSLYGSGIHVKRGLEMISSLRASGYSRFKVKIGFDMDEDIRLLGELCSQLAPNETLSCDANQAWSLSEAMDFVKQTSNLPLSWLEEPLVADAPLDEWRSLKSVSNIPIAAGENIAGLLDFKAAISGAHFDVLQPDIAKWGGFTGCYEVAKDILKADLRYCPHFLGGGIGLLASAHLLAATGGDGWLEVDANPNPLRELFSPFSNEPSKADSRFPEVSSSANVVRDGVLHFGDTSEDSAGDFVGDSVGLGVTSLPEELKQYQTLALSQSFAG